MLCCHFRRLLAQLGVGEYQREFQASSGSFGWGLEGFTVVCLSGNALLLLGLPQGGWKVVYWAVVPPTHTHTYTDRQTDRHKRMQTNTRRDRQTHNDKQEGTRNTTSSRSVAQSMCASAQRQQYSAGHRSLDSPAATLAADADPFWLPRFSDGVPVLHQ